MPFPTFPADLEKAALAAVEKSTKIEIDLSDDLTKLKTAFSKIDAAAFQVPKKVANENELTGFQKSLDGEMTKIKTFAKSLTDFNKAAFAKTAQLKKDKAPPAAVKHVDKILSAGTAFVKTLADLGGEADELVKKARLLLQAAAEENEETEDAPGAPKADTSLVKGLTAIKSQPGLFALAIGKEGARLVAGPRLVADLLKQAKAESGGGNFIRGDCEWSDEKKAYVFVLAKKPPGGLAKKIRTAILDQTLKKLQVKVLVRGPGGPEIDAETDADTMGAVDLEDAPELTASPPPSGGSPAPSQLWDPARVEARGKLRKLQTLLAKTKHALALETVGLIDGILKKVDIDIADKAGAEKLTGYLNSDPDVADLENVQINGEGFGIRAALLQALQSFG